MNQEITDIKLSFKCPVNYNEMQAVPGGRFCNECQKIVHDFTDAKAEYFWQVVAESAGEGICGRFKPAQLTPEKPSRPWIKWLSAAAMVLGISLPWHKAMAQTKPATTADKKQVLDEPLIMDEVAVIKKDTLPKESEKGIFGLIEESMPEFPGGNNALSAYFLNSIKLKTAYSGRVFVQFMVEVDGSVNKIKILRGANKQVNDEVIRVIKSMPKWKPAFSATSGKPVATQFTLPITIN